MTTMFRPTWLMIKQHNKTGFKYFCKTMCYDPIQYLGSGTVWRRHLRKHGKDVTTIWHQLFTSEKELVEFATKFSIENNIVEAKDDNGNKLWANLIPENGLDGGYPGIPLSAQQRERLCDEWLVSLPSGEEIVITNMLEFCKQHGLNPSTMSAVARGYRGHHKSYKCRKLTNNRDVVYEYKEYVYMTAEEKSKINSESVKKAKERLALPKIEYDEVVYYSMKKAMKETGLSRYLLVKNGKLLRNN